MWYFLVLNPGSHKERDASIREYLKSVNLHSGKWHAWHHEDSEYTVVMAEANYSNIEEVLKEKGAIVWPHLADHDQRIEDQHHLGKVPAHVGIKSGDTTYAAGKKLAAQWPSLFPRLY